ncbi:isochorismatase family protein [Kribbella sp. NBC_01505]|uniref:isochorismatase family protein n=1 Tax=Kribbella sp. NBC_01505 TaxID=2903580 RepID=UPI00386DCD87
MTTLPDRPNTALLVIDVQNGVVSGAHERDQIIANINTAIGAARAAAVPVIFVQHSNDNLVIDSEEWQIVAELERDPSDRIVRKTYPDSFDDTELEAVLADGGIGRVFITGAQTDECVRGTLHGAITRGYDVTLVADGHTTEDLSEWGAPTPDKVIAHTNLYWHYHRAPGRTAAVQPAAELTFTS